MPLFLFEQFISGLTQGSVYALLALGFTLIFGTLRMVTFAHGEVYMIGAYVGFEIIRLLHPSFFLALLAALIATALLGIAVELLAFHFLRNAPHATSLLVTIGISILLVNLAQKIWGPETQSVSFKLLDRLGNFEINVAGVYITFLQMAVLAFGGQGNLLCPMVGAATLILIPEIFRPLQEYRMFVYGGILIVMMLVRRQGLLGGRAYRLRLGWFDPPARVYARGDKFLQEG